MTDTCLLIKAIAPQSSQNQNRIESRNSDVIMSASGIGSHPKTQLNDALIASDTHFARKPILG